MFTRRTTLLGSLAALGAAGLPAAQAASRQPDGPVTLVVGSTPGTGNDTLAQLMAPYLQQKLGQPVVAENRTGASGVIAAQYVSRAAPDGRTLLVLGDPFVTSPSLMPNLPYKPDTGFTFISMLAYGLVVLAVRSDLPVKSVREFVTLAKSKPGALNYASPGNGTPHHMIMALFGLTTGIDINHVPYSGSAQAIQDLLGRRVDAMMLPVHVALPLMRAEQIRVLAVGSETRAEEAPDIPTLAEAGYPMENVTLWYGLFGPPAMPEETTQRINAEVNAWLALPDTKERLRAQGMVPGGGTPEAFRERMLHDIAHWGKIVKQAGIQGG